MIVLKKKKLPTNSAQNKTINTEYWNNSYLNRLVFVRHLDEELSFLDVETY